VAHESSPQRQLWGWEKNIQAAEQRKIIHVLSPLPRLDPFNLFPTARAVGYCLALHPQLLLTKPTGSGTQARSAAKILIFLSVAAP
jgi:hypothetical protein